METILERTSGEDQKITFQQRQLEAPANPIKTNHHLVTKNARAKWSR
jgi:hypothetical protein